jgi:hypothetical protein
VLDHNALCGEETHSGQWGPPSCQTASIWLTTEGKLHIGHHRQVGNSPVLRGGATDARERASWASWRSLDGKQ